MPNHPILVQCAQPFLRTRRLYAVLVDVYVPGISPTTARIATTKLTRRTTLLLEMLCLEKD